jgi:hypothetical protein
MAIEERDVATTVVRAVTRKKKSTTTGILSIVTICYNGRYPCCRGAENERRGRSDAIGVDGVGIWGGDTTTTTTTNTVSMY